MEPTLDTKEDPLIAALPPATDYITYLTILEYQLKPANLPTLNNLLSNDDGKLAAEIGWDLLKLVLPMLQIIPEEANKCLSIIARRGNPREVVVRVSEELERLGQQEDEREDDEVSLDQDGLPNFSGEAPPVHLGDLKLDATPTRKVSIGKPESVGVARSDRNASINGEYGSDDHLILQSLLSMLGSLHPRIKTQYPSRFLATSLPAALRAYRRMRITTDTTSAFIDLLSNLSGKRRPALPPRTSTQGSIPTTSQQPPALDAAALAPPLPDPEAKANSSIDLDARGNESAIIQRLLQAVMLEVLDEYTNSFQSTMQSSMNWTIRLREKHEPRRVLPNKPTESQRWTQSPDLKLRDEIIAKILKLSKDLELDIGKEIAKLVDPTSIPAVETIEEAESDYPTTPSQIPFPVSGVVLLFAAQNFAQDTTGLSRTPPLALPAIRNIFRETFAPAQNLPHLPSLSQTDALLSLIYTTIQSPLSQPQTPGSSLPATTVDLPFLTNLTNLFTTSPDPFIRDSTHHLTTILLHNHTSSETKLLYIKSLLSPHQSPASPIHEIQQGNLRALAINWLKDEFLSYHTISPSEATSADIGAGTTEPPIQPPVATTHQSPANPGLDPSMMHTDPELLSLIFPNLPHAPTPFITGQPAATAATPIDSQTDLETLLLQVPSYIAALNLISILASLPSSSADNEHESVLGATSSSGTDTTGLLQQSTIFLAAATAWKDLLLGLSDGIAQSNRQGQEGPVNIADVYALEDAVGRARSAIDGL